MPKSRIAPLTKAKNFIRTRLTAEECYKLQEYCRQQAMRKAPREHIARLKAVGVGGTLIIRGSYSRTVELGLACLKGTVKKFDPKRVQIILQHPTRPGLWRIPYSWLTTLDNEAKELKAKERMKPTVKMLKQLNKVLFKEPA